jgi:hypothetical protein
MSRLMRAGQRRSKVVKARSNMVKVWLKHGYHRAMAVWRLWGGLGVGWRCRVYHSWRIVPLLPSKQQDFGSVGTMCNV